MFFLNLGILGMLRDAPSVFECFRELALLPFRVLSRVPFLGAVIFKSPPSSQNFPIAFVGGWHYRCHQLTEKFRDQLASAYRFKQVLSRDELDAVHQIHLAQQRGMKVVGLHVRRGDYATWQGGQYLFSDDFYSTIVETARTQFQSIHQSCFVVAFTNDTAPLHCGQDFSAHGRWFADLFAMQECDLLIGPPSTFTMWASYVASVPYLHVRNPDDSILISSAVVCSG